MECLGRSTFLAVIGFALIVVGVSLLALGTPAHKTVIDAEAENAAALANATAYSAGKIDATSVSDLSPAERAAFAGARQSEAGHAERGSPAEGDTFDYRNDVVNRYVVEYGGDLYLVRVWTDVGYLSLAAGVCSAVAGVSAVSFALWRARRERRTARGSSRGK